MAQVINKKKKGLRVAFLLVVGFIFAWAFQATDGGLRYFYAKSLVIGSHVSWLQNQSILSLDGHTNGSLTSEDAPYGRFRLAGDVVLSDALAREPEMGLFIAFLASYRVYWDGRLIGENGVVGNTKEEERPGLFHRVYSLPEDACGAGEHRVTLEFSNFHRYDPDIYSLTVYAGPLPDLFRRPMRVTALLYGFSGLYLICAFYFFFHYIFAFRSAHFMLFALTCCGFTGLVLLEYAKYLFDFPYFVQEWRLWSIHGLTFGVCWLLPMFCTVRYWPQRTKWTAGSMLLINFGISFLVDDFDERALTMVLVSLLACLIVLGRTWSVYGHRAGLSLSGIVFFLAMIFVYDLGLFIGSAGMLCALLVTSSLDLRDLMRNHRLAMLRTQHLETELLKKQIQPHFLMNSMAALIAWIERDPGQAVRLARALSEEMRLLLAMSSRAKVAIEEELALCRAHLQVMSLRKEYHYPLNISMTEKGIQVPAGLVLTLIENGLTHSKPIDDCIGFEVKVSSKRDACVLRVRVRGIPRKNEGPVCEGTGGRYVKARLEEAFPGAWQMESGLKGQIWETVITVAKVGS